MRRRIYSFEIAEEARALRATGLSARETAARLGLNPETVRGWLGRFRPQPVASRFNENAKRWVHSNATVARARDLFAAGTSRRDISRQLGIPYTTVNWWLRQSDPGRPPEHLES